MDHDKTQFPRRGDSPPTDRVVAIVELLAAEPRGSSVAEVTERLELSRSTVTSVLTALEHAGWVRRGPDRSYTLGPGLVGVADAVRNSLPLSDGVSDVLSALADRIGCGVALSVVQGEQLTFLEVTRGRGRIPAGVTAGTRLPLHAPVGATVIAHAEQARQDAWLGGAPESQRYALERLLAQIRRTGVAVFQMRETDASLLDVLADVVELLAEHPTRTVLRERVFGLIASLSGHPYTTAELDGDTPLPVSYLIAPVRDSRGEATYELQIGPLRPAVTKAERDTLVRELLATADALGTSMVADGAGRRR